MRPDILNPLFAEVEALKGVGPNLAKPLKRLDLARALRLELENPLLGPCAAGLHGRLGRLEDARHHGALEYLN